MTAEQQHPNAGEFFAGIASPSPAPKVESDRKPPHGYTAETWTAKQAEVAEFSRRNPADDPTGEGKASSEARLRAACDIQCADVPDQFALVRRWDLGRVLSELTFNRAGKKHFSERFAALAASPPKIEQQQDSACEAMNPDEEGWSEWIHPLPGYRMQCCDCGLIHEMEFAIGETEGSGPLNDGERRDSVVLFRARNADYVEGLNTPSAIKG